MQRKTSQREAIKGVFASAGRPLTAQEVLDGARDGVPSLGIATVYRALKALQEEGILSAVELPGETVRYDLSDKPHHHHFLCRGCKKAFIVENCPGNLSRLVPEGFRLEAHEIVLKGLCPNCLKLMH